jgi:hypothetical protein
MAKYNSLKSPIPVVLPEQLSVKSCSFWQNASFVVLLNQEKWLSPILYQQQEF